MLGRVPRLGQRVLNKGVKRLGGFRDAQRTLRQQLKAQRGQHGVQLGEFAGVVGGQNNLHAIDVNRANCSTPSRATLTPSVCTACFVEPQRALPGYPAGMNGLAGLAIRTSSGISGPVP